jgi:hypothetical protein
VYLNPDRLTRLASNGVPYFDLAGISEMGAVVTHRGAPHHGGVSSFSTISSTAPFMQTEDTDVFWEQSLPSSVVAARKKELSLASFQLEVVSAHQDVKLLNQDTRKARHLLHDQSRLIQAGDYAGSSQAAKAMLLSLDVDCWGDMQDQVSRQCKHGTYGNHVCDIMLQHASNGCRERDRYYSEKFVIDCGRRFEVMPPGRFSEADIHIIEVWPWDDLKAVAQTEGDAMGLATSEIDELWVFLNSHLEKDESFKAFHRMWLLGIS